MSKLEQVGADFATYSPTYLLTSTIAILAENEGSIKSA